MVANSTLDLLTWPWTQPEFYKVGNSLKSHPLGRVLDTSVDINVDTRLNWVGIKIFQNQPGFQGNCFSQHQPLLVILFFNFLMLLQIYH
jgi:hypothetical protein